jgi:hypothetical protein
MGSAEQSKVHRDEVERRALASLDADRRGRNRSAARGDDRDGISPFGGPGPRASNGPAEVRVEVVREGSN